MVFVEDPGTGVLLDMSTDDEGFTPVFLAKGETVGSWASLSEQQRSESFHGEESETLLRDSTPFSIHQSRNITVDVPSSTLVAPKSSFLGFDAPLLPVHEKTAISELMRAVQSHGHAAREDFIEFELDQFTIYVDAKLYPNEMRPLQHLAIRQSHDIFYFDGVLSIGETRQVVRRVKFAELPIGNYGFENPTVEGQIWIRSVLNARREVYYRLKRPAPEYARFYEPFLWIADFAKHVIDFCSWMIKKRCSVTISSFKDLFSRRLQEVHARSPSFQRWYRKHGSDDFRASLTTNVEFICKEAYSVLGGERLQSLPVFSQVKYLDRYQPESRPSNRLALVDGIPPTVVTPYIMQCFSHMKQGRFLRLVNPSASDDDAGAGAGNRHASPRVRTPPRSFRESPGAMTERIQVGDTISTPPDGETTGTKWRKDADDSADGDRWFGLVQKVHINEKTRARSFDVTWLYKPIDTPCCKMRYPWDKELFLSDHCTCEEGRNARVDADEVLAVHNVDWFGAPDTCKGEFFIRQTYLIEKRRWVTLDKSHLRCKHGRQDPQFKEGDTVLATLSASDKFLEPFELLKLFRQDSALFVRLRRLRRRSTVDRRAARPNELVYTEQMVVVKMERVVGKCVVRVFDPDETIPDPYNRNGTGNLFFMTHRLEECEGQERCVPLKTDFPIKLRQGFDPKRQDFQKLRGLDLFCGGGNFGRGLEDGGAVEMRWACDLWDKAIHTYMANTPEGIKAHPYLGSTDDLLQRAIEGKFSNSVPRPGEVDFISAGSPCPGFSLLTVDKTTPHQIKNQSLVASFASFVEFYRPKYGILENVPTIVPAAKNRTEDIFSQLICSIVGMGYQTQLILGDAWSYGSPQGRSRVFLYFAAPGFRLPEAPLPSHSHFPTAPTRNLGEMSNGEPYVCRSNDPTAFKFVSAAEGTADLPPIYDAKPDCCVPYPDHRICIGLTSALRHQIAAIPNRPYGMNFVKTWQQGNGVMTVGERELFPHEKSSRVQPVAKGWGRVRPNSVMQTITTACGITDARNGTYMHWLEPRPMSIMEARRAQGFPDHEVLVGEPAARWRIIGNSVARQVALALGLQFREAWLGTLYDDAAIPVTAAVNVGSQDEADELFYQSELRSRATSISSEPDQLLFSSGAVANTPRTSVSETPEAQPLSGSTRKRPLHQTLVLELHTSKIHRLQDGPDKRLRSSTPSEGTVRALSASPSSEEPSPPSQTPGAVLLQQAGSSSASSATSPATTTPTPAPLDKGPTIVRLLDLDEKYDL